MRLAAGLGLLTIQERRRQCNRNGGQPMKAESAPTFRRAVAFPLPTVEEIEAALDELLAATLKHARERDEADIAARAGGAGERSSAHGVTADALLETEFLPGEAFIADPIGRSLREGVNMLGKALFALTGSTDVMQEVCDRVCDRDPANWGRRADIMSKRWDGIGDWHA